MSRIGELQDAFQRAVLTGDDRVLETLSPGVRTTTDTLLDVYKDAYKLRLIEVMQQDHELLQQYVGEETFEKICRGYINAHPSHTPNARNFALQLPEYLSCAEPYSSHREICEIAELEKSLNDAFDCVDAPVMSIKDLSQIDPESWSRLTFCPHPSVACLYFKTNAADIWQALKEEKTAPKVLLEMDVVHVAVWRQDTTPMMRVMSDEEAMMWDEAAKGVTFGLLCEMAATFQDADTASQRAAQYLSAWLMNGMITSFQIQDP